MNLQFPLKKYKNENVLLLSNIIVMLNNILYFITLIFLYHFINIKMQIRIEQFKIRLYYESSDNVEAYLSILCQAVDNNFFFS